MHVKKKEICLQERYGARRGTNFLIYIKDTNRLKVVKWLIVQEIKISTKTVQKGLVHGEYLSKYYVAHFPYISCDIFKQLKK